MLVGAALAATGCHAHHSSARRPPVDPDAAALQTARSDEAALIAAYDAALVHARGAMRAHLLVGRAAHDVHLKALRGTPPPVAAGGAPGSIPSLLRASVARLQTLASTAHVGDTAAVLASIAASHQAIAEST